MPRKKRIPAMSSRKLVKLLRKKEHKMGTPFLSITVAVVVGWATVQSKRQDLLAKWQNK